ncbi:MAG: hypothetical protein OHK0011_24330 [Turneriella sp.]
MNPDCRDSYSVNTATNMPKQLSKILCLLLVTAKILSAAPEVNPGFADDQSPGETESALRRGEVIFFISYPFTFLGSLIVYNAAASGIRALDTGRSDFVASGGFYALVATTAAFLSFGIAMNDYHALRTQTRAEGGAPTSYLAFDYRF